MKRYLKFFLTVFTAALAVFALSDFHFNPKASGQKRIPFFTLMENPKAAAETEKSSLASVRESEIKFNLNNLTGKEFSRISFPLFDGEIHEAVQNVSEGLEFRALDDFTWRGRTNDDKLSGDVILTFKKGAVSGLIYAEDGVYEIVPKGEKQILVKLDQNLFPECGGGIKIEEAPENPKTENVRMAVDSGDRIDVLLVYTTATKTILGGDTQAQALAQQAIDATNTAYINSKIRQRVRIVHMQEYLYTESGNSNTDLSNLRNNAEIQSLRNAHKADLVAMIGEFSSVCGLGYLMGGAAGNSNSGFTLTARSCAVGNLSFAHELGHNMGSQHNPENGTGSTYPYGFGHYVNGVYRTVMSYVDPCSSGCPRRPYFSNPGVEFSGHPTGIENARDNARSINNTADVIANYRYSGTSLTLNNYNDGEAIPRYISRPVNWSSDNLSGNVKIEISRDDGTNWETLIASTPNDGSETINIIGRPTKRARLRITSINSPWVSDSSVRNISIK